MSWVINALLNINNFKIGNIVEKKSIYMYYGLFEDQE